MKIKIFVTGGSGFIGQHLLRLLSQYDFEVHALTKAATNIQYKNVEWHFGDLFETNSIESLLRNIQPHYLIHLAWYVEHDKFWQASINEQYILATLNLYQAFNNVKGMKALFIGSFAEYGENDTSYYAELETPLKPTTLYGIAKKRTFELLLHEKVINNKAAEFVWVRLFHVFGPGENVLRFIPSIFRCYQNNEIPIVKHPNFVCDYIFVTDFVRILLFLLFREKTPQILNVGTGNEYSLYEIANLIHQSCYPELPEPVVSAHVARKKVTPDLTRLKALNPPKINSMIHSLLQLKEWHQKDNREKYEAHH